VFESGIVLNIQFVLLSVGGEAQPCQDKVKLFEPL